MSPKEKPRILYLVQLPPPIHGASLMNESLVTSGLVNKEYEAMVIDIAGSKKLEEIGSFSAGKLLDAFKLFSRIRKTIFTFRPHLVYFTLAPSGYAFYRDVLIALIIKAFKTKLVIHLHGQGIQQGVSKSKIFRRAAGKVFKDAYVIHLSDGLVKDTGGISYRKGFVVNCCIPVVQKEEVKRVNASFVNLLFLSNYVRSKGIIDLLEAIKQVAQTNDNFHLRLVGKPFDVSVEELEAFIQLNDLGKKVTVCGPRYGEEKFDELRRADVFVFPTFNDAFPLVLLEAMQFSLPIISTREGGIPDMIQDGCTGLLVEKRNIPLLVEKISFLLHDEGARLKMGSAARKVFMQKYTLPVFEQSMQSTFEAILND